MRHSLRIAPRTLTWALFLIVVLLTLSGLASAYGSIEIQRYFMLKVLFRLFYLNEEANIPAWFSSSQWLLAALLAALIGFRGRRHSEPYATHWTVLGLIFLGLSADEAAAIHEAIGVFIEASYATSGYFTYGWVLFGIPFVVIFVIAFARFLLHLPPRIRTLFIIAGGTYVSGALGLEMVAAANEKQLSAMGYQLVVAAEEFAEMLGVVVLIYALLSHIEALGGEIVIKVGALADEKTSAASSPSYAVARRRSRWVIAGVAIVVVALLIGGGIAMQLLTEPGAPPVKVEGKVEVEPDAGTADAEDASLFVDQTLSGQLGPGDRRLSRDGSYVDVHVFEIPANALVTIWMRSTEFDPYLVVVRSDGTPVTQDDAPRSQNSQVEFVIVEAGSYSVLANAYNAEGVGSYELRFRTQELVARPR